MGIATHLGMQLIGTVKNTTGTVAGTVRNTGATVVNQDTQYDFTGAVSGTAVVVPLGAFPAGSSIIQINIDTLTAFTGSTTANLTIGTAANNALYWASTDITAQGRASNAGAATKLVNWCGLATTASPDGIGIGPTDVLINAYLTPTVATVTAGKVQINIIYTVNNADGTDYPQTPVPGQFRVPY
jgi:hypothetical protein